MNRISNFLEKFLKLDKENDLKLQTIKEVIKQKTNLDINKDMLEIKNNYIKLNYDPVVRNEIFMHKGEIEKTLQDLKIFLKLI